MAEEQEGTDATHIKDMYFTRQEEEFSDEMLIIPGDTESIKKILEALALLQQSKSGLDADVYRYVKGNPVRYGDNPHQKAAAFRLDGQAGLSLEVLKDGKAGPSKTNYGDLQFGLEVSKYFEEPPLDSPMVLFQKHQITSGGALGEEPLEDLVRKARETDAESAYGATVVFNREVDRPAVKALKEGFFEVCVAPSYTESALKSFRKKTKKNEHLRIIKYSGIETIPKYIGDRTFGPGDIHVYPSGDLLLQDTCLLSRPEDWILQPTVEDRDGATYTVERAPTEKELQELTEAWFICAPVRSNSIVWYKEGHTVSVVGGKQARVAAVRTARDFSDERGGVMASDGFLPFRDSVDEAAECGVTAMICPGGSRNDAQSVIAANELGMSLVYTGIRTFVH